MTYIPPWAAQSVRSVTEVRRRTPKNRVMITQPGWVQPKILSWRYPESSHKTHCGKYGCHARTDCRKNTFLKREVCFRQIPAFHDYKRSETMRLCVCVRFMRNCPKRPNFLNYKFSRNVHAYTRICYIFTFGLGTNVSWLVCCIFWVCGGICLKLASGVEQ